MVISYAQALARISTVVAELELAGCRKPVTVTIEEALGRTSAQEIVGERTLPPYDNSAMDGFVCSSHETMEADPARPVRLQILGSIAAGDEPPLFNQDTPPRSCYLINTGAPFPHPADILNADKDVPRRFDACARKEDTIMLGDGCVDVLRPISSLKHRRKAGEDYLPGTRLMQNGQKITPEVISALASHGITHVKTVPFCRIAVLATGKELEGPGTSPKTIPRAHIFDSNSLYTRAALFSWGFADVRRFSSVGDNASDYGNLVKDELLGHYDLLISSGGVSKGQHDYVEGVLRVACH